MGIDPEKWLQVVRGLAEQNSAVRVSLSSRPMEEGGRCVRVRVLELRSDKVTVVEEPGLTDLGQQLREGTEVDVLAVKEGLRLLGRCRVTGQIKYMLNKTTRVGAVSLSVPFKVTSGQLRDYYRAPVGSGVDISPVHLRLDSDDEAVVECALAVGVDQDATYKARLVNISGGGVGLAVLVDRAMVPAFHIGVTCSLNAELPSLDKPLDLQAQIVHVQKMDNGDLYLGLAFVFDDPIVQKQIEDQLQRLSVWLQRRHLKNER